MITGASLFTENGTLLFTDYKLVISLYAKGMSVSDIEDELRSIYEINLSGSSISIITNKVTQAAQDWQNRPLERQFRDTTNHIP